ncbi:MAG: DUF4097 family beta strand repeat-containing protein [Monoglobaceae bacterium]
MTAFQRIIKYLAMAFAIFLSISIISGICGALFSVASLFGTNTEDGIVINQVIGSDFSSISLNLSAAELEIKTGDKFDVETNHKYLKCEEKDDILKISETRTLFASGKSGMKVILTVPQGKIFDYVDIRAGAGTVTIDELYSNMLNIDLGAGELIAQRLDALYNAEIDGVAGSVTIKDGHLSNADIDMGVGELNLTSELSGKSSIDYGIGETNLALLGTDNDYKIKLDKGIGEALIDGRKMSDDSVYGAGESFIEIDGGVGKLNITFKENTDEKGADVI